MEQEDIIEMINAVYKKEIARIDGLQCAVLEHLINGTPIPQTIIDKYNDLKTLCAAEIAAATNQP